MVINTKYRHKHVAGVDVIPFCCGRRPEQGGVTIFLSLQSHTIFNECFSPYFIHFHSLNSYTHK